MSKRKSALTNELHFPVIKGGMLPHSLRSMDEINEWIEQDYQLFFNREAYEREKRACSVNVPFVLTSPAAGNTCRALKK
jgi:hypothetical protein